MYRVIKPPGSNSPRIGNSNASDGHHQAFHKLGMLKRGRTSTWYRVLSNASSLEAGNIAGTILGVASAAGNIAGTGSNAFDGARLGVKSGTAVCSVNLAFARNASKKIPLLPSVDVLSLARMQMGTLEDVSSAAFKFL